MFGWVVAVAAVTCACSFDHGAAQTDSGTNDVTSGDVPSGPWLAGYSRRKLITITAPISSTLTDFPVGIIEGADPQLAASARDDGRDLVFTTIDGTTTSPTSSCGSMAPRAHSKRGSVFPRSPPTR